MAELADAQDLKSCEGYPSCGFESRSGYCRNNPQEYPRARKERAFGDLPTIPGRFKPYAQSDSPKSKIVVRPVVPLREELPPLVDTALCHSQRATSSRLHGTTGYQLRFIGTGIHLAIALPLLPLACGVAKPGSRLRDFPNRERLFFQPANLFAGHVDQFRDAWSRSIHLGRQGPRVVIVTL